MNCACGGETAVYDSRPEKTLNTIYRRRKCLKCGERWTTIETRTSRPWLSKKVCKIKGCSNDCEPGKLKCKFHIVEMKRAKSKRYADDLIFKERFCKKHPSRPASPKTTMLKCLECLKEHRDDYNRNRRNPSGKARGPV